MGRRNGWVGKWWRWYWEGPVAVRIHACNWEGGEADEQVIEGCKGDTKSLNWKE